MKLMDYSDTDLFWHVECQMITDVNTETKYLLIDIFRHNYLFIMRHSIPR